MEELTLLKKTTDALYPLPETTWQAFSQCWTPHLVKRKEIITEAGSPEKYLYFVVDGVQRIFYLDDKNREATLVLTYAPSFGGVIDSFLLQKPSPYYYESLTPSKFLRASFDSVQQTKKQHPVLESFFQKGLSIAFSGLLERMVELQCFSSEDKFKTLLKRSPHVLKLVPHKYLANYLGIDPTNFSKLINSVRI
jgi:CRP-like cAMP-binding protein